eukprot:TRINITY_DN6551_c0_g2_i2.p1 TRINITY_DN6551_c0_g2~~TRINITY_DN6551_c0_g2_i2.p1  ORF type:complete len:254 (-),score=50.04 TRINITY_DN6551_c0_g2_i2:119-880(-)
MLESIPQSLLQTYILLYNKEITVLQIISLSISISSIALSTIDVQRLIVPIYQSGYRRAALFFFRAFEIAISLAIYGLFAIYAGGYVFVVFAGKLFLLTAWAIYDKRKYGMSKVSLRCGHDTAGMAAVLMVVDFAITAYLPIALLKYRPKRVQDHFIVIGSSVASYILAVLISDSLYGLMTYITLSYYDGISNSFVEQMYLFLAIIHGLHHIIFAILVSTHPGEGEQEGFSTTLKNPEQTANPSVAVSVPPETQ